MSGDMMQYYQDHPEKWLAYQRRKNAEARRKGKRKVPFPEVEAAPRSASPTKPQKPRAAPSRPKPRAAPVRPKRSSWLSWLGF
jgi:hypothetical protein